MAASKGARLAASQRHTVDAAVRDLLPLVRAKFPEAIKGLANGQVTPDLAYRWCVHAAERDARFAARLAEWEQAHPAEAAAWSAPEEAWSC